MKNESNGRVQSEGSKTSGQVVCPKCGTSFAQGGENVRPVVRSIG